MAAPPRIPTRRALALPGCALAPPRIQTRRALALPGYSERALAPSGFGMAEEEGVEWRKRFGIGCLK